MQNSPKEWRLLNGVEWIMRLLRGAVMGNVLVACYVGMGITPAAAILLVL
jgi:hypothetical protein